MVNGVRRKCRNHVTYPVKRLFEFDPVNRPEALLDSLLRKTQPSGYTVSDSEPTEHFLFVVFEFSI